MKVFLDDLRNPEDCLQYMFPRIGVEFTIYESDWLVVRDYDSFVDGINSLIGDGVEITHVSFDHDIAEEHYVPEEYWGDSDKSRAYQDSQNYKEKTGEDCAKYLKEVYQREGLSLPTLYCHSMNPIGTQRIINVFK